MIVLPVASAAAMVPHGMVAEQVVPVPFDGETNAPFVVSARARHELPLHSWKPVLHANPHWLPAHVAWAFATAVLQTSPQLPQLLRSVIVSAHSVGTAAGHAVNPALQSSVHAPAAHAACPAPLVGPAHVFPQAPQLLASSCSSTQAVGAAAGQPLNPPLQANAQALFAQGGRALETVVVHALPHASQ